MHWYLKWRTSNANSDLLPGTYHRLTVAEYLESIFKERRLDWDEVLKVGERDTALEQLPAVLVRKMSEDELVRVGHKVVLVQLVAHILRRHLITIDGTRKDLKETGLKNKIFQFQAAHASL